MNSYHEDFYLQVNSRLHLPSSASYLPVLISENRENQSSNAVYLKSKSLQSAEFSGARGEIVKRRNGESRRDNERGERGDSSAS